MKDKLNQFVIDKQGHFIEVSNSGNKSDSSILWQCMDLAYDFLTALRYPKATIQNQYAYQVYTAPKSITKEYFDLIPNTPSAIPQDGDLVVWSNSYGPAGHIAIALGGGTTNSFRCFEQNNPLGTNAHIQSRNYNHVLGWLRPKVQTVVVDPQDTIDLKGHTTEEEIYNVLTVELLKAKLTAKDYVVVAYKSLQSEFEALVKEYSVLEKKYLDLLNNAPYTPSSRWAKLFYQIAKGLDGK